MSFPTFHDLITSKDAPSASGVVKVDYINWNELRSIDRDIVTFKPNSNIEELIIGPPKHLPIDGPQEEYAKVYSRFSYYYPLEDEVRKVVYFVKEKLPKLKKFTLDFPGDCEGWEIFKSYCDFKEMYFDETFGALPRKLKGHLNWNVLVRPDEFLSWFPLENDEKDERWEFEAKNGENILQVVTEALKTRKFPDNFDPSFYQAVTIDTHPDFEFRITFNCRWNHFKFDKFEAKYKKFVEGKKWPVIGDFSQGFAPFLDKE